MTLARVVAARNTSPAAVAPPKGLGPLGHSGVGLRSQ